MPTVTVNLFTVVTNEWLTECPLFDIAASQDILTNGELPHPPFSSHMVAISPPLCLRNVSEIQVCLHHCYWGKWASSRCRITLQLRMLATYKYITVHPRRAIAPSCSCRPWPLKIHTLQPCWLTWSLLFHYRQNSRHVQQHRKRYNRYGLVNYSN